jgi:hypothetical protein
VIAAAASAWMPGLFRSYIGCEVVLPEDLELFEQSADEPLFAGGR